MVRPAGLFWFVLSAVGFAVAALSVVGFDVAGGSQRERVANVGGAYGRYLAPDSVCPGSRELGAPVAQQQGTMVCLLNYARRVRGLEPLKVSPMLMRSAQIKAADIVRCRHFSHDACGLTTISAFERAGYVSPYISSRYGENLAWGAADAGSARGALLGWLESDEHRENVFRLEWTEQGIALTYVPDFRGVRDSRVWVSHFGHRG